MCGLTCSGKSTWASRLADEGWAWLSVDRDAWDLGHVEQPLPGPVQREIKVRHKRKLRELVAQGRDVVLDYALPSRARRDEYRALALATGARVELHHLDVAPDELHRRLARRNAGPRGPHAVAVSHEQLDRWIERFEPPGEDEHPMVLLPDGAGGFRRG
ncbi:ATP-binding protein [uncultured Tessaracoccus sp.]|uniref:AAA family ATPase n=1 Tax=uncultured Tessaracoccus sp. TaxID=905023 RepID=UPI0025E1F402|nr:ATP-binding protein [uncultured Tessaracoccus sp.]